MSTRTRTGNEGLLGSDDLVAVLVEAVLWTAWAVLRTVVSMLCAMVRHPLLTILGVTLAACWLLVGWRGGALCIAAVAVGLGTWRLLHPPSYRAHVHVAVLTLVRSAYYRTRWRHIAESVDLVVYDRDGSRHHRSTTRGSSNRSVQLVKVRATSHGTDRLLLRLPTGLVPADVATRCEAIAHATGCLSAAVRPDRPGRCWLELKRRDDLVRTVSPVPASETVELHAVPIGRREDGGPWLLKVAGTHLLVAGATGAGKSSVLWSLLQGVSRGLSSGVVQVWAVDPKGGMELRPGRALFTRYEDASPEDMCRLLEDLVDVKDIRSRQLADAGARVHQPTPESPHVIAVLDELATLTAFADRAVTRRIDTALGMLLTQGRACGITVVAAVQDPGKDIVGWRDLFPTRVAMRLDNPLQVSMVLGESARDDGARADEISELTPGVAYVRIDGTREIVRARAAYLDDRDVAHLVDDVSARRVDQTAGDDSARPVLTTADLPATMRATREGDQS
ncbi:FtsK/SpoIIIE domain-containing protein [Terrabacter carboxydivorans]|uniref:FtsK/SpoIIIE domain-containing protein n=1 Tax=Terrabacter carboxydivorans TaxID=619730 RepID=A0ABN3MEE0_9MICO